MTAAMDQIEAAKRLEGAGFTREQAETQVSIITALVADRLATKDDLGHLEERLASKEDLQALEARMVTKDDLKALEARVSAIEERMATKDELKALEARVSAIEERMVTKDELKDLEARMATKDEVRALEARMNERFATMQVAIEQRLTRVMMMSVTVLGLLMVLLRFLPDPS